MKERILNGAAQMGIVLTAAQAELLERYAEILKEYNKKVNLTAITDDEGIITKHFLDSLTALKTGYVGGRVIDVGCGAGFPGLVLKIACPEIRLTLLDSLNKRVEFLKAVSRELTLGGIEFIHGRAEEYANKNEYREKFDTVVSRAVANMRTLSEWCVPYAKRDGYFLALKGPLADSELADADGAIRVMGGETEDVFAADIPFTDLCHKIICVKKVRQTPRFFPRNSGLMTKYSAEEYYKMKK